ncbi:MAG: NADH-quinone oxidoreductase subunit J [Acidobacteria bacterium]|nr:MAG: NADH-quinone oxidoreductase subunit J [Acidobacteriota bacterium]
MDVIAFYVFAAIAVVASLLVIGQRNPMHSVMLLIVSFGALSGLYVLLDAPFTAVTQIIVYAGAIMVLFLFVVMLLNAHTEDEVVPPTLGPHGMKVAVVLSLALAAEAIWAFSRISPTVFSNDPGLTGSISSVARIGAGIFTTHAFAFEVTSVLILVAMVGAVVIARKEA